MATLSVLDLSPILQGSDAAQSFRNTVELAQHAEKLGYRDSVIVQLTLGSHNDETLYAFGQVLAAIPEIQEAYLVSGDYDYYIRIAVRDTRDYERLLREQLYKIPGIRYTQSHFVLRVLKQGSMPALVAEAAASPAVARVRRPRTTARVPASPRATRRARR